MTYRVQLTFRAERDVDHILDYLVRRSPKGAATWAARWNATLVQLSESPGQLPLAPENEDHEVELRHVVFKTRRGLKYRVIFFLQDDLVLVTHIRGPGQDLVSPHEMHNS